jgi:hypothetical protein
MTGRQRAGIAFASSFWVALAIACGGGGAVPDKRTPGQYFKEEQGATITPHGKIRTDTVEERNGKIEYSTQDGHRWSVDYSKRADGTYDYRTPEPVKK